MPLPVKDRFKGIEALEQRVLATATPNVHRRERLIRAAAKYPLVRIEETVHIDPNSGVETLWDQHAMAADHVLVRLRDGETRETLKSAVTRRGYTIRSDIQAPGCFLVAAAAVTLDTVTELTAAMGAVACVDIAEPDFIVRLADTTPNDPSYGSLWGMPKIEMPKVWDMTTGDGGVVVAVFDTGTMLSHPDLLDNLWQNPGEIPANGVDDDGNGYIDDIYGWDFYDGDNDPSDVQGHGTHVAGTIGAVGNNAIGVAGVGWNIKIMTIKFFGYSGQNLQGYASDAMAGVYYVIKQRTQGVPIRVTNHSWGGSSNSQILRDALEAAGYQGILHVAAAGNNGTLNNDAAPHYPSSFTLGNMIAVANTTQSDGLNSASHYGANSVDLGAPGVSTYSTTWNGGYGNKSGTSMSTPHVSGVAALIWDYMPHLSWQDVRDAILDGVDPLASLSGRCTTEGRLNAYGAFENLDPSIEHTPLENTTDVASDHVIEAVIRPGAPILDTNKVVVLWNTTGDTNAMNTNVMENVSGDRYQATIPAQQRGTAIFYMIQAETETGRMTTDPADAPGSLHSFDVTYPVTITVAGSPAEHGSVFPDYGTPTAPWGSVVSATASLYTAESAGHRYRNDGWLGYGSVPWFGSSNTMSFTLHEADGPNFLLWFWEEQYALTQTSLTADTAVNTTTWWDTGETASTVTAPATINQGGTDYAFTHWLVDGSRSPSPSETAVNPATGIVMSGPREATAVYLPEAQDNDGDGLPDWWEAFNFAHFDSSSTNDPDGDGFSNAAELADLSDPRDAASTPSGPTIDHTPLADPQPELPPWTITATVTDRVGVASVMLAWQRNGGDWTSGSMTYAGGDVYSSEIPAPHELGDQFAYRIDATDTVANSSTGTVHTFLVAYPLISATPDRVTVTLPVKDLTTVSVALGNDGNAFLEWELLSGWVDPIAAVEGEWSHSGQNEQWHIATQETHSGDYAWYCGNDILNTYNHSMDARLVTPAVALGTSPILTFWQWAEMEHDARPGWDGYYWDGAVIDISTNDGVSFERIVPVGGYPYLITPNDESPYVVETPCLGGDGGWEQITFDLSEYAGETVRVQFRFASDMYTTDRGWFIDDVAFSWGADWLTLSPTSGTVSAESTSDLPLVVNTTGLQVGTHRGALPLACNDPTQPILVIPVTLDVTEAPQGASIALAESDPQAFVISWQSTTSAVYSLMTSTNLRDGLEWTGVPDYTNLPGIDGTMSYTGVIDGIQAEFYRVDETLP